LLINENLLQRLQVAAPDDPQTRFYNLAQNLNQGENVLKIGGVDHDLGIQSIVIHCTAALPVITVNQAKIILLAPMAGQNLPADKPLDIIWTTANLPDYARFDIDYLDKNENWQTIDKGIPHNYPTLAGNRGFYRWEKLPADVHPQLQVRLRYETKQSAAGSTWTEKNTGMTFVYIPPGCFNIGSPKTEVGHQANEVQTRVCVEGFWMGKTEVTNKQYRDYKQSHDSGSDRHPDRNFDGDNQPVVKVNQSQAHAHSQWLSQKNGEKFRLPTEAEWEYAARAGQTTAYYWGENPNDACQYANVADRKLAQTPGVKTVQNCNDKYAVTAPVAQFKANDFGLYDMLGNVAEWTCSAMPSDNSYTGVNSCNSGFLVSKGGSWGQFGEEIRLAKRVWYLSSDSQQVGFRLIRVK